MLYFFKILTYCTVDLIGLKMPLHIKVQDKQVDINTDISKTFSPGLSEQIQQQLVVYFS